MSLDALVRFYEELTPGTVSRLEQFYAADAWFKDPFNEVRGVARIERIFSHMYSQVRDPKFVVTGQVRDEGGAVLVWELQYGKGLADGTRESIRGVSHLLFDAEGKVSSHRDYWDTGEELYMKLPVLGWVLRGLRRLLRA